VQPVEIDLPAGGVQHQPVAGCCQAIHEQVVDDAAAVIQQTAVKRMPVRESRHITRQHVP
jgi:hypothetical protein